MEALFLGSIDMGLVLAIIGIVAFVVGVLGLIIGSEDGNAKTLVFGVVMMVGGITALVFGLSAVDPRCPHHVTLYSGNNAVVHWISKDTPWADQEGFEFTDQATGKHIRVRGVVVVEPVAGEPQTKKGAP